MAYDTAPANDGNSQTFDEILNHANWLVKQQTPRVQMQEEFIKLFMLEWDEKLLASKPKWVLELRDPTPHNTIHWLVDVLSVNNPTFSIEMPRATLSGINPEYSSPYQLNRDLSALAPPTPPTPTPQPPGGAPPSPLGMGPMPQGNGMPPGQGDMMSTLMGQQQPQAPAPPTEDEIAEILENIARLSFEENDQRQSTSLQRDLLYQAFICGTPILKMADLRQSAKWKGMSKQQLQKLLRHCQTPFSIRAPDPTTVYDEWDEWGLSAVLHRYRRSLRDIQFVYGTSQPALRQLGSEYSDMNGEVIFCEWWTRDTTCAWVEKAIKNDQPLYPGRTNSSIIVNEPTENVLGFIPFVIRVARGTRAFDYRKNQLFPMLYPGWKSKLFYRSNLLLSVVSTLALAMTNPQFVYKSATGDKPLDLDWSSPGVIPIGITEELDKLEFGLDPDIEKVMTQITQLVQESTVSKTIAGQAPGGVTAAAGVNLLIQGGKLTIFPIQLAVAETYKEAIRMIFDYIKGYEDDPLTLQLTAGETVITPDMIPDFFTIKVELKADLPSDKTALVNASVQAITAGLISRETGQDWIGIEDKQREKKRMDEDIAAQLEKQVNESGGQQIPPERITVTVPLEKMPPDVQAAILQQVGIQPQGPMPQDTSGQEGEAGGQQGAGGLPPTAMSSNEQAGLPFSQDPQQGLNPQEGASPDLNTMGAEQRRAG